MTSLQPGQMQIGLVSPHMQFKCTSQNNSRALKRKTSHFPVFLVVIEEYGKYSKLNLVICTIPKCLKWDSD